MLAKNSQRAYTLGTELIPALFMSRLLKSLEGLRIDLVGAEDAVNTLAGNA